MVFETIVHHTVRDDENPDYVEENGPFPVQDYKKSYIGRGYYFWDDHIDLAHWWGEVHCNRSYMICQADFKINKADFCDLLGSRQDQKHILALIDQLQVHHLSLGEIIELLKEMNERPNFRGIFPYKAIRAIEIQENSFPEIIVKFSGDKQGITSLTPKILICLIEKGNGTITNFKIVYPDTYVE